MQLKVFLNLKKSDLGFGKNKKSFRAWKQKYFICKFREAPINLSTNVKVTHSQFQLKWHNLSWVWRIVMALSYWHWLTQCMQGISVTEFWWIKKSSVSTSEPIVLFDRLDCCLSYEYLLPIYSLSAEVFKHSLQSEQHVPYWSYWFQFSSLPSVYYFNKLALHPFIK